MIHEPNPSIQNTSLQLVKFPHDDHPELPWEEDQDDVVNLDDLQDEPIEDQDDVVNLEDLQDESIENQDDVVTLEDLQDEPIENQDDVVTLEDQPAEDLVDPVALDDRQDESMGDYLKRLESEFFKDHDVPDDFKGRYSVFVKGATCAQLVLHCSLSEVLYDKLSDKPPLTSPYAVPRCDPNWPYLRTDLDGDLSYLIASDGPDGQTWMPLGNHVSLIVQYGEPAVLISYDFDLRGWDIWIFLTPGLLAHIIERIKHGSTARIVVRARLNKPVIDDENGGGSIDWQDEGYSVELIHGAPPVTTPFAYLDNSHLLPVESM